VDQIVVVTSLDVRNQPLIEYVRNLGYACEQAVKMMCSTALCEPHGHIEPMW